MSKAKPPQLTDKSYVEACVYLGLVPPFTLDAAKAKYRELAKLYHPDVGTSSNVEKFNRIRESFATAEAHPDVFARAPDLNIGTQAMRDLLTKLQKAQSDTIRAEGQVAHLKIETQALRDRLRHGSAANSPTTGSIIYRAAMVIVVLLTGLFSFLAGRLPSGLITQSKTPEGTTSTRAQDNTTTVAQTVIAPSIKIANFNTTQTINSTTPTLSIPATETNYKAPVLPPQTSEARTQTDDAAGTNSIGKR